LFENKVDSEDESGEIEVKVLFAVTWDHGWTNGIKMDKDIQTEISTDVETRRIEKSSRSRVVVSVIVEITRWNNWTEDTWEIQEVCFDFENISLIISSRKPMDFTIRSHRVFKVEREKWRKKNDEDEALNDLQVDWKSRVEILMCLSVFGLKSSLKRTTFTLRIDEQTDSLFFISKRWIRKNCESRSFCRFPSLFLSLKSVF
jgi:hypothetical protein